MPRSAECSCHAERSPYCRIHGLQCLIHEPEYYPDPTAKCFDESLWVRRDPPDSTRVLMNVHPETRRRLRKLLAEPEMDGMGYSAFINRAVEVAEKQISVSRVSSEG